MPPSFPSALVSLGARLRQARLARNETQALFACRVGVSLPTYRKLEQGAPCVSLETLLSALVALGREKDLDRVLEAPAHESLFERFDREHLPPRKRVSRTPGRAPS